MAMSDQPMNPTFTASTIFEIKDKDAEKIVQELGFGNLSLGLLGLIPIVALFRAPAAVILGFRSSLSARRRCPGRLITDGHLVAAPRATCARNGSLPGLRWAKATAGHSAGGRMYCVSLPRHEVANPAGSGFDTFADVRNARTAAAPPPAPQQDASSCAPSLSRDAMRISPGEGAG
jgi:hypothetical protein